MDEVVDEPKIEAEPAGNVVEPAKEKAPDTRINTNKGNKVAPG